MKGKKVLITRTEGQAKEFREGLEKKGAVVTVLPMIEYHELDDLSELHRYFEQLDQIDWLVFTSATAVRFFFEAAQNFDVKFYFFPELKIATVGEKTKLKLEQLGYRTNFVPIQYTAEVLAENMDESIEGKTVLIPRSNIASNEYIAVFEKRKAIAKPVTVYENKAVEYDAEVMNEIIEEKFDYLTFTSGSTFIAFHDCLKRANLELSDEKIVCIGPSTAKVVEKLGYAVTAVAENYTTEGIIDRIKKLEENV